MKKDFKLKTKYASVIYKLTDKQAGILFKMIFEYIEYGPVAGTMDELVSVAFEFIKIDLDNE